MSKDKKINLKDVLIDVSEVIRLGPREANPVYFY